MTSISVDSCDPTPPFEQIRKQFVRAIDRGELGSGQRLPTVRQLAADLRIAPGTVSRAYKELEAAGYVETRRAAGTRVLARPQSRPAQGLSQLADDFVTNSRRAGVADDEIVNAVRSAIARNTRARQA